MIRNENSLSEIVFQMDEQIGLNMTEDQRYGVLVVLMGLAVMVATEDETAAKVLEDVVRLAAENQEQLQAWADRFHN